MTTNRDFEEFFASLGERGVAYLVIGGMAYNHYAPPRATKDIDVWVQPTEDNVDRLIAAIGAFGFPTEGLGSRALLAETSVLMLGRVPNRIDVITQPLGVSWAEAWERRVSSQYGTADIQVIGIEDLIRAKRAAGRPRDLADVAMLERIAARSDSANRDG